MKAILLAGGQGTRLRPLTLNTPKPVVPIFGRPFLHYQIDRILQVPEIDEIVLSLNYQPERIEAVFGDGSSLGTRISYVVEPAPLGTAGGIKFASRGIGHTIVVFNGDVLTQIDLAAVIAMHRARKATATIVLTPVENPAAYGLVETDARRQHPAVHREAGPGADHHQLHQCRHLRPRAVHVRPHSRRRAVVDRAQVLPVPRRAAARRSSPTPTTATGSTSARPPNTPRSTTTSWRAASMPGRSRPRRRPGRRWPATPWWRPAPPSKARPSSTPGSRSRKAPGWAPAPWSAGAAASGPGSVVEDSILWPDCVVGAGASVRGAVLGDLAAGLASRSRSAPAPCWATIPA